MVMRLHRIGYWFYKKKFFLLSRLIRNVIYLLANSYIPSSACIGKGSVFAYGGIGVVIHANAIIGEDCVIGQGITIGASEGFASSLPNRCPIIGKNCYIAAGARILGDITIGDNCQIGAGAVVLRSIPANSVVVGMPGKVIKATANDFRAIMK